MLLYHGTSSANKQSILQMGIHPRGTGDGHWEQYPSRPDMVYLTSAYPFYFGLSTGNDRDDGLKVVFEIDTDKLDQDDLYPDEDYVVQSLAAAHNVPIAEIHDQVRSNLEQYRLEGDKPAWCRSVEVMSTCAYRGTVPPQAITRYCLFDWHRRPALTAMAWNEGPHIGCDLESHRKLTEWFFGDRRRLPRIFPGNFFLRVPEVAFAVLPINYTREGQWRGGIQVHTLIAGLSSKTPER